MICGYDFGRVRNQIVGCCIEKNQNHPDGFIIDIWEAIDFKEENLSEIVPQIARDNSLTLRRFENADFHVLETQVAQCAGRAVNVFCYALSFVLQTRLLMRSQGEVCFMGAKKKFAVIDPDREFCSVKDLKRKVNSKKRKRWAVDLCTHLVRNQDPIKTRCFREIEKKDDFADAFLTAYTFWKLRKMDEEK